MPNHVTQKLTVEHPDPEWIAEQIGKEFTCGRFIPKPASIPDGNLSLDAQKESRGWNWLDWCNKNWGTKWGTYSNKECVTDSKSVVYRFESAWSVCLLPVLVASQMFPDATLMLEFIDEGWGFAGVYLLRNGQVSKRDLECSKSCAKFVTMHTDLYGEAPEFEEEST